MGRSGVNIPSPLKRRFEKHFMKIVFVDLGYVRLSNAVLQAPHNEVLDVNVSQEHACY